MKTLTAQTLAHLARDVTSLAACWRITRVDGTVHRFTDSDVDVAFPSTLSLTVQVQAGERYLSVGAFSRTNIEVKAGLRIDNLDLSGLVNADSQAGGIYLQDLVAQKFNDAEVEIFLVNWQAPGDGVVPMMRGHIGEVLLDRDAGTYRAEMRGLSQRFVRKLGDLYSPTCRADLFDARCGLQAADYVQRSVVESVGSNKSFTVPANEVLLGGALPGLGSGLRSRASVDPDGALALRRGPEQLGTKDAPFLVSTPAQLDAVRSNPFASYALVGDVDMTAFGFFTPIPNFKGSLDGRGHEVVGLNVDRPGSAQPDGDAALFGSLLQGALVRRLGIRGGRFHSGNSALYYAAPLAARTDSVDRTGEYGAVEDCYSVGCQVLTDATTAPDRMSGLVGRLRGLRTVRRCLAASVLHAPSATNHWTTRVGNVLSDTEVPPLQAMAGCYSDDGRQGVGLDYTTTLRAQRYGRNEDQSAVSKLTTAAASDSGNSPNLDYAKAWLEPELQAAVAMVASASPLETLTFAPGSPSTITRDVGSWVADGFRPGDRVLVSGAGVQITTVPTNLSVANGGLVATLDALAVTGVNLVTAGWLAGMVVVVSGAGVLDGSYLVLSVTTNQLRLAPGVVLPAASTSNSQATLTASNDRYFDVASVSASVLSLVDAHSAVPQVVADATAVSVSVVRLPRLRVQEAA